MISIESPIIGHKIQSFDMLCASVMCNMPRIPVLIISTCIYFVLAGDS